jgi:hypothetical protein
LISPPGTTTQNLCDVQQLYATPMEWKPSFFIIVLSLPCHGRRLLTRGQCLIVLDSGSLLSHSFLWCLARGYILTTALPYDWRVDFLGYDAIHILIQAICIIFMFRFSQFMQLMWHQEVLHFCVKYQNELVCEFLFSVFAIDIFKLWPIICPL